MVPTASLDTVAVKQTDVTPGVRQTLQGVVSDGPGTAAAAGDCVWITNLLASFDTSQTYKNRQYLRGWPIAWYGYSVTAPSRSE